MQIFKKKYEEIWVCVLIDKVDMGYFNIQMNFALVSFDGFALAS